MNHETHGTDGKRFLPCLSVSSVVTKEKNHGMHGIDGKRLLPCHSVSSVVVKEMNHGTDGIDGKGSFRVFPFLPWLLKK